MVLFLTLITLLMTFLVMPDVFSDLLQGAVDYPGYGIGLLAVLVLVGVWIDRR